MGASNGLNISQSGYVVFDGVATFTGRTFQAGPGITLTNANGVAGNTTIGLGGTAAPFVNAYVNTNVTNVTGDGTDYVVIFDQVTADATSSYNSSNGLFIAPIDGNYLVTATVMFTSITEAFTFSNVHIATNGPGNTDFMTQQNPGKIFNINNQFSQTVTANVGITAGTHLTINAMVSGSTKSVGITGNSFGIWTFLNIQWVNP